MGAFDTTLLLHIVMFLAFSFVGGYVATRLKLPALLGYIVSGVLLGFFIEKTVSGEFLSQFANLGIILLLFTVGLEINLQTLQKLKKYTVMGGLLQLSLCAFFITLLALGFRMTIVESILIGCAFTMSSTAIVAKIIADQGEENSLTGALALGMLVFQDLAAIPLIIILSAFSPEKTGFMLVGSVLAGIVKATIVLVLLFLLGQKIVPYVFKKTGAVSREILNLFTILFIFSMVALFSILGLSPSIAAFLAGVLVGQTLEHYHIFSQIRPLRDIFTILFFVYLGASVDIGSVLMKLPIILLFTLFVIAIKYIVTLLIFIRFKFHSRTSFSVAIHLSQVGEFAFILLSTAFFMRLITDESYYFVVTSVLLSIIISTVLIKNMDKLYTKSMRFVKRKLPDLESYLGAHIDAEPAHINVLSLKNHVVLCGYGRVGHYIGRALTMAHIPFIAIDYNLHVVEKSRREGTHIIYGDPTDIDILDYAQVDTATCLISAVPQTSSSEMIILNTKKLNQRIIIFSRANQEQHRQRLRDLGAHVIIQPEFEASLAIIRGIYATFNIPKEDVLGKIKRLRIEHGMG